MASEWNYYAIYQTPDSTLEEPPNVLRQRPGAPRHDAEVLSSDGGWAANSLLEAIDFGHNDKDVSPITHEEAARIARRKVQDNEIPYVPRDLDPDGPPPPPPPPPAEQRHRWRLGRRPRPRDDGDDGALHRAEGET